MSVPARPVTELPRSVPVGLARRTMRTVQRVRTNFVFGAVLLLFVAVLLRLVRVQLVGGEGYRELVAAQSRPEDVRPLRGPVLDRHGRAMALSRTVRHVQVEAGGIVNPKTGNVDLVVTDVGRFAMNVADLLDGVPSAMEVRSAIQERRATGTFGASGSLLLTLRRNIDDPRVISRLDAARIPGLKVVVADRRDYPNGAWGSMVVGIAKAPDASNPVVGMEGVEAGLEKFLSGTVVRRRVPVDGRGRRFVTPREIDSRDDADGRTVWLALDLVIQGWCEQALDRLVEEWRPRKGAVAIVMDPSNGDVLAMAQRPAYDPASNDPPPMNLATQYFTEVGSTFKPVTASRALELGVVTPQERFELPRERTFTLGRAVRTVHDSHDGGERVEGGTVLTVIAQSNNPDTALLAFRIGPAGMRRLIEDLGVQHKFPLLGFPRESAMPVDWDRFGALDHLSLGFGHGMTMTPLRLASIFCAFAREDFRPVTPRLVLAVGGEAVPDLGLGPTLLTDPARREVIREALRAVVTEGTAKRTVLSDKYDIAGKTGTAKNPVGVDRYYSCSFVGFAPADHPRLLCLVMALEPVSKPNGAKPYGGAVAGPAVRTILERTLEEYMGVPPRGASEAAPDGARTGAERAPASAGASAEEDAR